MKRLLKLLILSALIFAASPFSGCASTKGKALVANIQACTATDPGTRSAMQAALACLVNVATSDYAGCLAAVPVEVAWSIDEIACVVKAEEGQPTSAPVARVAKAVPAACPTTQ